MSVHETNDEIDRIASHWVVRRDAHPLTPDENAQLENWLQADPRRQGAFIRAQAAWVLVNRARALPESDLTPSDPVATFWTRRRAIAAGLAGPLLVSGAAWLWPEPQKRYRTALGEIRRVLLDDGSTAIINTSSEIAVEGKTAHQRFVELTDGEVWFKTVKDARRPFIVRAADTYIRAEASAFSVRRYETATDILVGEGTADIWNNDVTSPVSLNAGYRVRVSHAGPISAPVMASADNIRNTLAWRDGKIILDGMTLAESAAEFNRYNKNQIVVVGDTFSRERVVGVFDVNDLFAFVTAASRSLGARAVVQGGQILLKPPISGDDVGKMPT